MNTPRWSRLSAALVIGMALSATACGAGSPLIVVPGEVVEAGAGPFLGTWAMSGTATEQTPSGPGTASPSNVIVRIENSPMPSMSVTFSDTSSASLCTISAQRRGNSAVFADGAMCTVTAGGTQTTLTFRMVTMSVTAGVLTFRGIASTRLPPPSEATNTVLLELTGRMGR
ncbi:MAG: hypothetical protein Q8Q09_27800 [Deltaproteobacteria bacterium]|nr:hypothetical protein [Deltaproteobacteria bacterium]